MSTPQATNVLVMSEAVPRAKEMTALVIVDKKPAASIAPPKAIALRTSHTVPSMPLIPEVLSRSDKIG